MKDKKENLLQLLVPDGLTFEEWVHYETSGALNIGYHQSGLIPRPLNNERVEGVKQQAGAKKTAGKAAKSARKSVR